MKPESSAARQDMFSAEATARDMQRFVKLACGAQAWNDNIKARIARAARVLGITPRRAKAFLYLEARVIPAHEYMRLRSIVDEIEGNARAIEEHDEYLARMATAPAAVDCAPLQRQSRNDCSPLQTGGDSGPAAASGPAAKG